MRREKPPRKRARARDEREKSEEKREKRGLGTGVAAGAGGVVMGPPDNLVGIDRRGVGSAKLLYGGGGGLVMAVLWAVGWRGGNW